jgi:hypothetical protein
MNLPDTAPRVARRSVAALGVVALCGWLPSAQADIEGLSLHGFADVYYTSTTQQNAPEGQSGFKLGNLDLYIAPSLSDRWRALMEDVVEFDDWTAPGQSNGQPSIDIERLQVGYLVNDDLTIWMGRFHTPYGYWNTAYHHGAELQPTVMRPQFIAFEDHGGVMPAHMDGLWLNGRQGAGPGRITYDVYFGNGSRVLDGQLDMQNAGNTDSHTATGARLGYEFLDGPLSTLWVGVHTYQMEIPNYVNGVVTTQTDSTMVGAFMHWTPGDWELMGEYYHFDNKAHDASGPTHASWAGYAEVDYTFFGRVTPLVRYEGDSLDQHDGLYQYLQGGQSYKRFLIGVRFDVTPTTALKFDANHTNATQDGGQSFNEMHMQVAFRF